MKSSKSTTPILDGVVTALIALDLFNRRHKSDRPTLKQTKTTRQIYDAKRGKIIELTTTTETFTDKL